LEKQNKKKIFDVILNFIEKTGNALPHPATLFAICAGLVIVASFIGSYLDWNVIHPATKETIRVTNLMSIPGLHRIMIELVPNFTSFAPLGIVLVAMLGIGVAEHSGFINSLIKMVVLRSPKKMLTTTIIIAGIFSHAASDAGYVLLIPLAGIIFHAAGRHPLTGMVAAFAGVSGGFSANFIIGPTDPMLSGITQEAARILSPGIEVLATSNYYFMATSAFMIVISGTWITEKIVEPRLGKYTGTEEVVKLEKMTPAEKKGLMYAGIVSLIFFAVILAGILPETGFLRDHANNNSVLTSPLIKGIITIIFLLFIFSGIAYGIGCGKFKSDSDIIAGMESSMKSMGLYIVLAFFAAQFVSFFNWSKLGVIVAVNGAEILMSMKLGAIPLVILFVLMSGFFNLFIGSASAKWALLAPIFVPIFMILGFSPELAQAVYRIGDSTTNIISPMMAYFALIIAFVRKYDKNAGIGSIISLMLPYTLIFTILWTILLVIWIQFGLPLGPGAALYYTP
jgi:aminobenzoyl-glutamate transport protein